MCNCDSYKDDMIKNIRADIIFIDKALDSDDKERIEKTHKIIEGKYLPYIPDFPKSMEAYNSKIGFHYSLLDKKSMKSNLSIMQARIDGYLQNTVLTNANHSSKNNISFNVPISNVVNVSISFDEAVRQIESMDKLSDEETKEIKDTIKELKRINEESLSKKKRWEKIKPIVTFAISKSVDIATIIISLVGQILKDK